VIFSPLSWATKGKIDALRTIAYDLLVLVLVLVLLDRFFVFGGKRLKPDTLLAVVPTDTHGCSLLPAPQDPNGSELPAASLLRADLP